jgi:hypothetical protein
VNGNYRTSLRHVHPEFFGKAFHFRPGGILHETSL